MFDLIIQNGQILDGSGGEAFSADIAVENGKIARSEEHTSELHHDN